MKHSIDHLVLCVNDLDRARAFYERLGFTLTPKAQQPFGTANHLAQMQGSFLELLAVADANGVPVAGPGQFSFGAFNAEFLSRRQGMSMLVFPSDDARKDQRTFAHRGLDTYEPFDFSRKARLPDGGEVTVSFSLAFVTHPRAPDAAFFACQQHTPQYFWKPEYQRHANGARTVVEVLMVDDVPARLADFFGRLLDPDAVAIDSKCLRITLDGGAITVLDPRQAQARCAEIELGDMNEGPRLVGFGVAVEDVDRVVAILQRGGIPFHRMDDRLQVTPRDAFGAIIEFTAVGKSC